MQDATKTNTNIFHQQLLWGRCGRDRMVVGVTITYRCNQCLWPLTSWVQITLRRGVLDIILCDNVVSDMDRSLVFSRYSGFSINETDRHDITEKLLKVALSTINQINLFSFPNKKRKSNVYQRITVSVS
jgi:hypothetical protein